MDAVTYGLLKNKIEHGKSATDVELDKKLDKNQGTENSGKIAGIDESGDIVPMIPQGVTYNEETQCLEYGVDEKINLNVGIQLDDTLSKVGYAADAAKVGELKGDLTNQSDAILDLKSNLPYTTEKCSFSIDEKFYWSLESDIVVKKEYEGEYKTISPIEVKLGDVFHISGQFGLSLKSAPIILVDKSYNVIWHSERPEVSFTDMEFDIQIVSSAVKYMLVTIYHVTNVEITKRVLNIEQKNINLKGKYMSLLGDSISSYVGTIPTENKVYYTGSNSGVSSAEQMWWKVLCSELEINPLIINGWSGSCVTNGVRTDTTEASNISRCQNLHNGDIKPDIVLVAMGVNDYSYNAPLGTWNGSTAIENTDDFSQAYAYMLDKIHSAYPKARIFCITPWFVQRGTDVGITYKNSLGLTENDYAEKIKVIAPLMNAKVIDGSNIGFNRYNYYPDYCIDNSTNPTHPNANGQYVMGKAIAKALKAMFESN